MSITVLDPGPLTTVQDAGRVGYAAQGYRSCGAADGYAYRLGNVLVGNDPGAAVLECTLRGAALRFETDTVFALTGAESPAALDSTPVPYYAPLLAKAGSVLQMGAAKTGLRSYLAVGGGIATPPVLGSRATDVKCGIGGLEGRKLTAGDTLPIGSCDTAALWQTITAKRLDRPLRDKAVCGGLHPMRVQGTQMLPLLRAVPGPQDAAFTVQGRQDFIHGIYTLTPDCDRMACKLAGTPLQMRRGADILSDGIVPGSVQVSADGQPIVMLADHQTTGGYAKIATVISADLPALAQLRPGQRVCFTFVTPAQAVQVARQQTALWQQVRKFLDAEFPDAAMVSEWGEPDKSLQGGFHMDFLLHFGPSHYNDLFRCDEPFFSKRGKGDISEFVETYKTNYNKTAQKGLICIPSGNHDMDRLARRLQGDELKIAFAFLLSMPGAPFIYYGDEIGMRYVEGLKSVEGGYNRTGSRSPMQWDDSTNAGFSSAPASDLYITMDPGKDRPTAKAQMADPDSLYHEVKKLIQIRQSSKALLSRGTIEFVYAEKNQYPLAYVREAEGEKVLVIINPSDKEQSFPYSAELKDALYTIGGKAESKDGTITIPAQSAGFYHI